MTVKHTLCMSILVTSVNGITPLWQRLLGFAYMWLVFGVTFTMKAFQTGVKPYYISDS